MNITLYKAAEDLTNLLDQVDSETGEMPEGYEQAHAIVARKGASVAAYIANSDAISSALKQRSKELADAAKRVDKRNEWLRGYLASNMKLTGIQKIDGEDFSVKLEIERDAAVEIIQQELIPMEYMREVPAKVEPDKALIKRAISDGYEVPGARITKRDRLVIK